MTYHYYWIDDILSYIGGLRSVYLPTIHFFWPLAALYFLRELCKIIKEKLHEKKCFQARKLLDMCIEAFIKILKEHSKTGELLFENRKV